MQTFALNCKCETEYKIQLWDFFYEVEPLATACMKREVESRHISFHGVIKTDKKGVAFCVKSGKSTVVKNRQPWNANKCHMRFLPIFFCFCLIHTPLIIVSTCPLWLVSLCHLCFDVLSYHSCFFFFCVCALVSLPSCDSLVFKYLLVLTFVRLFGSENGFHPFIVAACALSPALIFTNDVWKTPNKTINCFRLH